MPSDDSVVAADLEISFLPVPFVDHGTRPPAGHAVTAGRQTEIGGNDRYVALCRRHHSAALAGTLVLSIG